MRCVRLRTTCAFTISSRTGGSDKAGWVSRTGCGWRGAACGQGPAANGWQAAGCWRAGGVRMAGCEVLAGGSERRRGAEALAVGCDMRAKCGWQGASGFPDGSPWIDLSTRSFWRRVGLAAPCTHLNGSRKVRSWHDLRDLTHCNMLHLYPQYIQIFVTRLFYLARQENIYISYYTSVKPRKSCQDRESREPAAAAHRHPGTSPEKRR